MSTLSELLAEHSRLSGEAVEHLQRVVAEWQLLADMSFADFLLWVPLGTDALGGHRVPCVAQARPTTAPTAHPEDVVAARVDAAENPQLRRAVTEGGSAAMRTRAGTWRSRCGARRSPSGRGNVVLAVLSRDTNLAMPRVPSPLEIAYLGSASDLCQMVADGTFPPPRRRSRRGHQPARGRRADPARRARPRRLRQPERALGLPPHGARQRPRRAVARRRHARRWCATPSTPRRSPTGSRPRSTGGIRCGWRCGPAARSMLVRALPLRPRGTSAGALVLVRDVTDLRRRDLALLSKDATIREIHHRVKNNLQTVAALLRLQARRTAIPEAARALAESVRRVNSIALVHESLSASVDERVDLDELVDTVLPAIGDGATAESRAKVRRDGSFGTLPAALATPLVLVLTELVHNALAHAFAPGRPARSCVIARAVGRRPGRGGGRRRHGHAGGLRPGALRAGSGCRSCGPCSTRSSTPRSRSGHGRAAGRRP